LIFNFIDLLVYLKLNRVYNKMGCIYKISCKDENITDCYIGSTINFKQRKKKHKGVCNNKNDKRYNSKLYQFIRENGGWDNWIIEIIEEIETDDTNQLLKKERDYINLNNSSLNTRKIHITEEEKLKAQKEKNNKWKRNNKEVVSEIMKEYRLNNLERLKQKDKDRYIRDSVKINCPICNVEITQHNLERHQKTNKCNDIFISKYLTKTE